MKQKSMYVGVEEVCADWGVSKSKAYKIIRELSEQLLQDNPRALTIAGKVNRAYYEECTLQDHKQ